MGIRPRRSALSFLAVALTFGLILGPGLPSTTAQAPKPMSSQALLFDRVLPDFKVKDLEGRAWQLADLKGKVTFVNVWTTWCPPCRLELPYVQKLFEAIKEHQDLQVLTLNLDEDPALVPPYIQQNRFTFPVIRSAELAFKIHPVGEVPQNWIIDPKGRRSRKSLDGHGEAWIQEIRRQMEQTLQQR